MPGEAFNTGLKLVSFHPSSLRPQIRHRSERSTRLGEDGGKELIGSPVNSSRQVGVLPRRFQFGVYLADEPIAGHPDFLDFRVQVRGDLRGDDLILTLALSELTRYPVTNHQRDVTMGDDCRAIHGRAVSR